MTEETFKAAVRTSSGLRDVLFDELDRLTNGQSNPQQAQAVSKLACQIINSVKAEVEFHSHVRGLPDSTEHPLQKTLILGTV
tara:strand:- start:508 stop:753 length:246 start_codon:yes stop_codon:yes gene_type:complete